jgi:hypothetical protein
VHACDEIHPSLCLASVDVIIALSRVTIVNGLDLRYSCLKHSSIAEREKSSARLIIAPRTLPTISLGRACNLLMPIPSAALTHQTLNLKCGENLRVEPRCRLVCVPTSRCVWYGQFAWRFGARHLSVKRSIRKRRGGQQHVCWKLMLAMESLEFVAGDFSRWHSCYKCFAAAHRANVKIAKKWLIHYRQFFITAKFNATKTLFPISAHQ